MNFFFFFFFILGPWRLFGWQWHCSFTPTALPQVTRRCQICFPTLGPSCTQPVGMVEWSSRAAILRGNVRSRAFAGRPNVDAFPPFFFTMLFVLKVKMEAFSLLASPVPFLHCAKAVIDDGAHSELGWFYTIINRIPLLLLPWFRKLDRIKASSLY